MLPIIIFCHSNHSGVVFQLVAIDCAQKVSMEPLTAGKFDPAKGEIVTDEVRTYLQHGHLDLAGYDAHSDDGANVNRLMNDDEVDPIGGCEPLKSYLCQIARLPN